MHILVAQINPTVGDFEGNLEKMVAAIKRGRSKGAEIILFSELSLCGYLPQDLLLHDAFIDGMEKNLEKIIAASQGVMVIFGMARRNPCKNEKPLLNSAAVVGDGKLLGFYDKWLLPTYDVFEERRYFEPGKQLGIWEYKGKKIAITICEDVWQPIEHYTRDPIKELIPLQPDLILNLSASPYHFQKMGQRIAVCAHAAKRVGAPLIMACQVGGDDQLVFDGYSVYVGPEGELRALAKGFQEDDLFIDLNEKRAPYVWQEDPLEDLFQALVIGTRDYFYKQGFKKACLGLSGGIDSALAAAIAVAALGKENVLGLAMPSRFSSKESVVDAEQLAKNLEIELRIIPIETLFDSFLTLLAPDLNANKMSVAEENLQARIRGMILMAFSNKYGYLLLSTGNKSEMAVGYCTLYGDMAGGLALISDLTKRQVYILADWINRKEEIIPRSIIEKAPSAELRPNQKDSDSLPSYDIVDKVVVAYVEEYLDVDQIAKRYQIPLEIVQDLVERIHQAEYKRRQAPPGIRVSKKAFRVGRCYPIVQKWVRPLA